MGVFCKKCGNKLVDECKFCDNCGAATNEEPITEYNDEEIRSELSEFSKLTGEPCLCSECGYNGFMGISNQRVDQQGIAKTVIYSALLVFVWIVFVSQTVQYRGLSYWILLNTVSLGIMWIQKHCNRRFWICPACKQMLIPQ